MGINEWCKKKIDYLRKNGFMILYPIVEDDSGSVEFYCIFDWIIKTQL